MIRATLALALILVSAAASAAELEVVTASGKHRYHVEIAADEAAREHGLMDRKKMAADHGMLFEFQQRGPVTFWMKNTYLPLDMLFIDEDGSVRAIKENATPMSQTLIPSGEPVVGVLELNAGQAARIGAKPGDKVIFPAFFRN